MSTHTPLPWEHNGFFGGGEEQRYYPACAVWDKAGETFICQMRRDPEQQNDADYTTQDANAKFIVKAVNAHDELLAACKAVAAALEREQGEGWLLWLKEAEAVHETASDRLAYVIAKAECKSEGGDA